MNTRKLRISADGKTLTQDTEQDTTDGRKVITTIVYQRTAGDSSWTRGAMAAAVRQDQRSRIREYMSGRANALKFTNSFGSTYVVALDDKPVPSIGPATIAGTMIAAKQTNDRTIETTTSREGVITGGSKRVLSADGRTMTVTTTIAGPNAPTEPSVTVLCEAVVRPRDTPAPRPWGFPWPGTRHRACLPHDHRDADVQAEARERGRSSWRSSAPVPCPPIGRSG